MDNAVTGLYTAKHSLIVCEKKRPKFTLFVEKCQLLNHRLCFISVINTAEMFSSFTLSILYFICFYLPHLLPDSV